MTSEREAEEYLRRLLAIDPVRQASAVVGLRSQFLAGKQLALPDDDAVPDHLDRSIDLDTLAKLRREFWQRDAQQLNQELGELARSKFPEVAATANRLGRVAEARDEFAQMAVDESVHPAFREALRKIVVAPPAESNRLREQQFAFIRPDRNPSYQIAGRTIKNAIRHIQAEYGKIYDLEQTWFGELFHYQPHWDLPDEDSDTSHGYGMLLLIFLTMVGAIMIVMRIFDLGN